MALQTASSVVLKSRAWARKGPQDVRDVWGLSMIDGIPEVMPDKF